MRPIVCVPCKLFFRPAKTGVVIEEGMPLGPVQADGSPDRWGPYKLWSADKWKCPGCGAEVIFGMGRQPIAEHFEKDYAATVTRLAPLFRVEDC